MNTCVSMRMNPQESARGCVCMHVWCRECEHSQYVRVYAWKLRPVVSARSLGWQVVPEFAGQD